MDRRLAQKTLEALELRRDNFRKGCAQLDKLGIKPFGNKGRAQTRTGCIMNLDSIKGECNPRLSFNYCGVGEIGCPVCLKALRELARGEVLSEVPCGKA